MKHKTISKILYVEGITWGGVKSFMDYNLRDKKEPKTLKEAKAIAGDFESLTKAEITYTTIVTETESKTIKLT